MTRHDKIKKIIKKLDQNNFSNIIFPIIRRVAAQTIGMGGESEERIEKRTRIQKLKRILSDEEFSEIIDDETYKEILEIKNEGGLVPVQPLSGPSVSLMYIDYVYGKKENSTPVKTNIFKKISIWFKKIFVFKSNKKKSKNYA